MKKLLLLLLCVPLIGFSQLQNQKDEAYIKDLGGELIEWRELTNGGKPLIICFWATWSVPSKKVLNEIAELYEYWQDETGVKVIAISIDDTRSESKVPSYVNDSGWEYEVYIDSNRDLAKKLGVSTVPHMLLFGYSWDYSSWNGTVYTKKSEIPGICAISIGYENFDNEKFLGYIKQYSPDHIK